MRPIFISGIGTGIGKTLAAAILTEALEADYWKPVQAGFDAGTDSLRVADLISNPKTRIHPETYTLQMAASPHIAANKENIRINPEKILEQYRQLAADRLLIIEGAGGLMVPLNEQDFVIDLVKKLGARLVLVSRNYLGSINHSLMSAKISRDAGIDMAGWIFNDQYLDYEPDIVRWSGLPALFSLPHLPEISRQTVLREALRIKASPGMNYLYAPL